MPHKLRLLGLQFVFSWTEVSDVLLSQTIPDHL